MIDLEKTYFCTYYPKCEHGRKCPVAYNDSARAAERTNFFKTRKNFKKFEEEPDCFSEFRREK